MDTAKVIRKSYKFRIYPSKKQVETLEMTLELCRELYNAALQERRDAWKLNKISVSCFDQINQLPKIKKIREDLKEVNAQVLQDILRRVDKTYKAYIERRKRKEKAGQPRFKGQNGFNSFCYPQFSQRGINLTGNKLTLPKFGKVKVKLSRNIIGKIKTCTIKREIDKWFVIFSVETFAEILPKTNKQIGIDAGIENFITLSDGTKIENFRFFERTQKKLRIAQRSKARKVKGSKISRKVALRVKKIHQKIRNQRTDFQHKISTQLVKDFDLIAIEKLNILRMSKGFLSKQIHDVAWSYFFNMLRYKAECADKKLVEVNPNGTSQTCICGERVEKKLNIRIHHCDECGLNEHRDIVSAKVILNLAVGQTAETLTCLNRESVVSESKSQFII